MSAHSFAFDSVDDDGDDGDDDDAIFVVIVIVIFSDANDTTATVVVVDDDISRIFFSFSTSADGMYAKQSRPFTYFLVSTANGVYHFVGLCLGVFSLLFSRFAVNTTYFSVFSQRVACLLEPMLSAY